ncbi:S-layer homology domain-containing protein [Paenibacillus sp. 1_12]|uniref:S-layer homology domain-containing protein n=1 Tax=Paenibacillus sp. 1_12 TaxID=1566278 RepID=UPI0008E2AC33|nr:S-layer homology domain-containing protein [Paenibacillus sp. 1_12]SFM09151.1 S-layer homology domain-containing protein [Paenibacillus sp. 1_12]
MKKLSCWLPYMIIVTVLFVPLTSTQITHAANTVTFSDTVRHWGTDAIDWAVLNKVVDGYADGTFHPDNPVSEPEFLAMLLRAYPEIKFLNAAAGLLWYTPYYDIAAA